MADEKNKKLVVSDEFFDIYKNLNVVDQIERMKNLSKRELYLLLLVSFDKFPDDDPVVIYNLKPFEKECRVELYDLMDGKVTNKVLIELGEESGDLTIETDNIIDTNGNKLPEPLTKDGVRDAKINIINKID